MSAMAIEFPTGATLPVYTKWLGFGDGKRIDFYEILRVLVENNKSINDALNEILAMEMEDAKRPPPYAECVAVLIEQLSAGEDFDKAIQPLVPMGEAQLIRAGLKTGDLAGALSDCILALESNAKMVGSVLMAAGYPLAMLSIIYFILGIFADKVIPPFERIIPPELWEGTAGTMHSMIEIFRAAGPALAIAAGSIAILVFVTLPMHWGGMDGLRSKLEARLPPWSIYRMTNGTAFLKTLASQVRAGIKIDTILTEMSANATPWLRTRLDAIAEGMAAGESLGDAMQGSGYAFPDKRAVKILKMLSTSDGFETSISSFAARWEAKTVKQVQAAAKIAIVVSTLVMGGLTAILFIGVQELTDQVEQRSDDISSRI